MTDKPRVTLEEQLNNIFIELMTSGRNLRVIDVQLENQHNLLRNFHERLKSVDERLDRIEKLLNSK